MPVRRSILLISVVAIITVVGLVLLNQSSTSKSKHPSLYDVASLGPSSANGPTPTPTPTPVPPLMGSSQGTTSAAATSSVRTEDPDLDPRPPGAHSMGGNGEDLRSSRERMDLIDKVQTDADTVFNAPAENEGWTVNQQDMDQQDYETSDGAKVTRWMGDDGQGNTSTQAEEAQLPNGQLIDRWYGDDGNVNQIMHQYDKDNSYSVYYFEDGRTIEATRTIKDGNEIFTKFDRSGRQIEKTYTPQVNQ